MVEICVISDCRSCWTLRGRDPWGIRPMSSHTGFFPPPAGAHTDTGSRTVVRAREKLLWSIRVRNGRQKSRKHLQGNAGTLEPRNIRTRE